jgi:hypothetical protein
MKVSKILLGLIIVLIIGFIIFQIFNLNQMATILRSLILPLVTVLYFLETRDKKSYFFYFLLLYSIPELVEPFISLSDSELIGNIRYYAGNILYVSAYIFLILEILKLMNLKKIFKRFPAPIVILVALDVYSVILVSDTSFSSGYFEGIFENIIEIIYNITIMLLLTITVINYMNRHTKKAMNLLVGAICIVFSEVIQVAYYYISDENILETFYSILLVFAFFFFYLQSSMSYAEEKKFKPLERLEA